jgi:hypothetical protein
MRRALAPIRRSMNLEGQARAGRLGQAVLQDLSDEDRLMLQRLGYVADGEPAGAAPER